MCRPGDGGSLPRFCSRTVQRFSGTDHFAVAPPASPAKNGYYAYINNGDKPGLYFEIHPQKAGIQRMTFYLVDPSNESRVACETVSLDYQEKDQTYFLTSRLPNNDLITCKVKFEPEETSPKVIIDGEAAKKTGKL